MDPNNLDGFQNSELGKIQPLEPIQPVQPMPGQTMEHPAQPVLQPTQPMQPAQIPVQPQPVLDQPVQQPTQPLKKKPNFMLIGIIVGAVVLLVVIGVIVAVVMNGGNKSKPAEPLPTPIAEETEPSPELAQSICEKHSGILETFDGDSETPVLPSIQSAYICRYYKNAQETDAGLYVPTYVADDFEYQIEFIQEDKIEEYWNKAKISFENITDVSALKMLKESGEMIGYYGFNVIDSQDGSGIKVYIYYLLYGDAALTLKVYGQNNSLAKTLIDELGFPDPERASDSGTNNADDPEAAQRDIQRKDDYTLIITSVNSYMANNSGNINNMIKDADPHTLTASKWMNESGTDPNGNPYELKAYSWDAWNNAPVTPFGGSGSQVFIIIGANCKGTDANGNSTPAKDKAARAFAVYGYLENGYYCQASGSAG